MKISEKNRNLKTKQYRHLPARQMEGITEYANQKASETGMSQEFIEKFFKAIHEESIEVQNIMID